MSNLLGMNAVMNIGCPDASCKQQQLERQEVHWNCKQQQAVWDGLQKHPHCLHIGTYCGTV